MLNGKKSEKKINRPEEVDGLSYTFLKTLNLILSKHMYIQKYLILDTMDIIYNKLMNKEGCTVKKVSSEEREGIRIYQNT